MCGREANSYTNYLGRYISQISVLREVEKEDREFLNFLRPGLEKHSVLPLFLTKLKEKFLKLNYTTAMNGADRAIVPIGVFEDIFPFKMMITQQLWIAFKRDVNQNRRGRLNNVRSFEKSF